MGGLDHQREANPRRLTAERIERLIFAGVPRHDRHARGLHQFLGAGLAPHLAHRGRAGADKGQAGGFHRIGEISVFRQEAVAGVDRLRAAALRHLQDGVAAKIAFGRARAANGIRLIGLAHMLGAGVGFGVHRHRADTQAAATADDAAGDFATVGNQDFSNIAIRAGSLR